MHYPHDDRHHAGFRRDRACGAQPLSQRDVLSAGYLPEERACIR